MNLRRRTFALTTLILMFSMQMYSEQKNAVDSTASAQSFLGRWDLTLKTPLREYPSWLEITQEERKDDMVFDGKLSGKTLTGTTTGPDGTPWQWTGERAPDLKRKSAPECR